MGASSRPPVKHTCYSIDGVIKEIKSKIQMLDQIIADEFVMPDEMVDQLIDIRGCLEGLVSKNGDMEELRSANEALRSWGQELVQDVSELEDEITTLKDQIEKQQETIDQLQ